MIHPAMSHLYVTHIYIPNTERLDLLQHRRVSVDLRSGLSRPLGRLPHRHLPLYQRRVVLFGHRRGGQIWTGGGHQGRRVAHDRGMFAAERAQFFGAGCGCSGNQQCQRRGTTAGRYRQSGQRECRWTCVLSADSGRDHCRRGCSAVSCGIFYLCLLSFCRT